MNLVEILKKNNFRITKARQYIAKYIYGSKNPITIDEIFSKLKKQKKSVDIVSIYRTTEILVRLKLILKIEFGDRKSRYEWKHENNHHHHFVCNKCGDIKDILIDENLLLSTIKKNNYTIHSHFLELFGLCENCG
jgi:Fur family transcriptional regulator, ferric uptake regulator